MQVTKVLGLAAVGALLVLAAPTERAQALSLSNPGAAAAVQQDTKAETTEVATAITERFPHLERLNFTNPFQPTKPAVTDTWLWPQDMDGNGMYITGWKLPVPSK